ncbi:hypothetical protein EB796_012261 [Bugula neritina]|uniref:Uncharacterized protein n=1 Tax=Bugula neritina TaxID=10212 RepID=A0A7J7IY30_BUGNE|nr:hypothetical protein EB796_023229 [Bugula neritina]KAF6029433.1 hypothetical protein EB796_012261 [Bugula neritina]
MQMIFYFSAMMSMMSLRCLNPSNTSNKELGVCSTPTRPSYSNWQCYLCPVSAVRSGKNEGVWHNLLQPFFPSDSQNQL